MTQINEVMTADPIALEATTPVRQAAQEMKDRDVGDVIVIAEGKVCGVVTDRDIVVRAVADGMDPETTAIGDICTRDVVTLDLTDTVEDAQRLMRENAIRRLPVVDGAKPVGIVSLGDLAIERDPNSALADISAAPAND